MRILIVGCKGFIGSHALLYYRDKGIDAYGCDVGVDYADPKYFQISPVLLGFDEVFAKIEFEVCINCSGASSVPGSFQLPARDLLLNVQNVSFLLDAIRKFSPNCRFVNLSSAAVYGSTTCLPIKEETICNPMSPYGLHKMFAEQICSEYNRYFGIQTCSLRIFSAFGPGLKKQLFWDWAVQARSKGEVVLLGSGSESRDYIYIDDLIHAIDLVIAHSTFEAEVINIGNGVEVFIKDAIRSFWEVSGGHFKYRFSSVSRGGDPANWCADNTKLLSYEYSQNVSFKEGLKRYVEWFEEGGLA